MQVITTSLQAEPRVSKAGIKLKGLHSTSSERVAGSRKWLFAGFYGNSLATNKNYFEKTIKPYARRANTLEYEFGQETEQMLKFITKKYHIHNWKAPKNYKFDHKIFGMSDDLTLEVIGAFVHKFLKRTRNITFDFSECDKIMESGLESLLYQMSKNLPDVFGLKLIFKECSKLKLGVKKCLRSNFFQYSAKLQSFELDLNGCSKLTADDGIQTLNKIAFPYLCVLKNFRLDLSRIKTINDEALLKLISKIHLSTSLEYLSLTFCSVGVISDNSFVPFVSKIFRNLVNLKQLDLCFTGCAGVTLDGLKAFVDEINKTKAPLEQLTCQIGISGDKTEATERISLQVKKTIVIFDIQVTRAMKP